MNLTTIEGVAAYMAASQSESDWNNRCDEVIRANGGYPSFWFGAIILSGLADKTARNWSKVQS